MTQPCPALAAKAADPDIPDLSAPVEELGLSTYATRFASDPMDVRAALTELEARLRELEVNNVTISDVSLVLAEVLNNVVEHAHQDRRDGAIHLEVFARPCCIRCQIVDNGLAMPGLELPAGLLPSNDTDLQDLPEGGFGWFLIRNMTADLTYQRVDAENRLQFNIPFES